MVDSQWPARPEVTTRERNRRPLCLRSRAVFDRAATERMAGGPQRRSQLALNRFGSLMRLAALRSVPLGKLPCKALLFALAFEIATPPQSRTDQEKARQ